LAGGLRIAGRFFLSFAERAEFGVAYYRFSLLGIRVPKSEHPAL
jgi:hypothetical protein